MIESRFDPATIHDDSDLFRSALANTEAESGFVARFIEKDYFCSLILRFLYSGPELSLVFKGGTCFSKVYTDFYRLSEDLDFVLATAIDAKRSERRARMKPVKSFLSGLPDCIPALHMASPPEGHNQSTQYIASLEYRSAVTGGKEQIKIEIGLREPLLRPERIQQARTLMISGLTRRAVVRPFDVVAMDSREAYAEKCRAALTRREPAVRDLFDIHHGTTQLGIDVFDPGFIKMVKMKLVVPGNSAVDTSSERREILVRQLDAELRPVLRQTDFDDFDLDAAIRTVNRLAEAVDNPKVITDRVERG